jgi:hypothetical protein
MNKVISSFKKWAEVLGVGHSFPNDYVKSEITTVKGAPFDDPANFNPACDKCGHQNSENCNSCTVLSNE